MKLLTSPSLVVMLQTFFIRRALEGKLGTRALGNLRDLGTWALRHSGTRRALKHSGTWALQLLYLADSIVNTSDYYNEKFKLKKIFTETLQQLQLFRKEVDKSYRQTCTEKNKVFLGDIVFCSEECLPQPNLPIRNVKVNCIKEQKSFPNT